MSDFEKVIVRKLIDAGIDNETADKVVNAILKAEDDKSGFAASEAMAQAAQAIANLKAGGCEKNDGGCQPGLRRTRNGQWQEQGY